MSIAHEPLPKELWSYLEQASTATVTTQLFKRGLRRMHLVGIVPVSRQRRLMGEARTLRNIPARLPHAPARSTLRLFSNASWITNPSLLC